jgi:hypothetical protein
VAVAPLLKPNPSVNLVADDQEISLRTALAHSRDLGFKAAQESLVPALIVQLLLIPLVVGYYLHWPTSVILTTLAAWREQGGLLFSFVSTGFCAGAVSEMLKVATLQRGQWQPHNTQEALFKFIVLGFGGVTSNLFYLLQDYWFGSVLSLHTVLVKVLLDQFLFSAFFACPFPTIVNHFRHHPFSFHNLLHCFTAYFFIRKILPLLIMNWCFWIPCVSLLYCLPLDLQFPFALCAASIWGIIFTAILGRKKSA